MRAERQDREIGGQRDRIERQDRETGQRDRVERQRQTGFVRPEEIREPQKISDRTVVSMCGKFRESNLESQGRADSRFDPCATGPLHRLEINASPLDAKHP